MEEENIELISVLDEYFDVRMKGIHTAFPAKVDKFDPNTLKAAITPLLKVRYRGANAPVDLPQILDVPVLFTRTSKTLDFHPLAPGDIGLAVCSERSISDWMAGAGAALQPTDSRRFDISDAYFIPGGYPTMRPVLELGGSIPSGAVGTLVKPGTKLYYGTSLPIPGTTANAELISIVRQMAEWMEKMNAAHAGAGTIPVAEVTAGIAALISAISDFEA